MVDHDAADGFVLGHGGMGWLDIAPLVVIFCCPEDPEAEMVRDGEGAGRGGRKIGRLGMDSHCCVRSGEWNGGDEIRGVLCCGAF